MRQLVTAACVAVVFAVLVQSIPIDPCAYLSPGSYWYEFFNCDSGAAGGGASGAR